MKRETQIHLRRVLERLRQSSEKILSTRGYTRDCARVKLLEELIKEQVNNENSDSSARPVR
jgi:hypothetical protein